MYYKTELNPLTNKYETIESETPIDAGGQKLYIWKFETGSDSVILPVNTFAELTVGTKGIGCGASSEFMYDGTITEIDSENEEATFSDGNFSIFIHATDESSVIEFPDLSN